MADPAPDPRTARWSVGLSSGWVYLVRSLDQGIIGRAVQHALADGDGVLRLDLTGSMADPTSPNYRPASIGLRKP